MRYLLFVFGLFLSIQSSLAETVFEPPRLPKGPLVDGVFEDLWDQALVVSDFFQRFPKEGGSPTERTEIRIVYTSHTMYIGLTAFDTFPRDLRATVLKRDDFEISKNDQFAMAIDSYNDARNGYWFSTNPIGARVDSQFFDEGNIWELNWDGIWNCETRINTSGWTAEIEIPFSTLRFVPAESNVMGINFFRRIIRTNEQLFAPLIALKYTNGTPNVSAARKYLFKEITGSKKWLMKPYVVSGLEKEQTLRNDLNGDAGIEVKYAVADSLTTNFSLNTDFAEIEVDERRINLSRFRLFFPEKRDFFLENAGNFQFGIPGQTELFFSRRIGLSEEGETVPVLFGTKLTGKIHNLEIGLLNSQTKQSNDTHAENFSVLRVKSGLGTRSYVGSIFTGRYNRVDNFATTLGLDFNLFLVDEVALFGFASRTQESANADGSGYHLALARGGERTSFRLAFTQLDESFQPAVGFVQRTGIRQWETNLFIPFYFENEFLRTITPGYEGKATEDLSEGFTDTFQRISLKWIAPSEDQILFFAQQSREGVPESFPIFREIRVPPGAYREGQAGFEFTTKPGRSVSGGLLLSTGGFYNGSKTEFATSFSWKLNRHFTFVQFFSTNFVELEDQSFRIDLFRSHIAFSLNTHLSTSALLQYDNSTRQLGINFRFGYLFREGTELFVVYDELREQFGSLPDKRRLLMKFTYLFAF
jgi:hypothetical protein